nr:MAG TPA: hypothetical protein [Caudoviricetes sp.]
MPVKRSNELIYKSYSKRQNSRTLQCVIWLLRARC